MTSQISVGVITFCLKFGNEDFKTAWWLRKNDPDRRRGRACFLLYTAWGLFHTAFAAFIVMGPLVVGWSFGAAQKEKPPWLNDLGYQLALGYLTLCASFIFACLITYAAFAFASWNQHKLWLHKGVFRARKNNHWPPPKEPGIKTNKARGLISIGLILFFWALAVPVVLWIDNQKNEFDATGITILCILLGSVFLFGTGILMLARYFYRFLADSPQDCWGG